MATRRFKVVNGLDNNSNTITNIGAANSTLDLAGNLTTSGAYAVTLTATGTTSVTLPTSGTLYASGSALGTPSSGTLSSCTGLPISTGVSGLGTGVATFLATPSSANLISAITDETGSGVLVFGTAPTFTTSIDGGATFGAFASSSTLTLGYTGALDSTTNISTGTVAVGYTKTINIGTNSQAGSTVNINLGASNGGTVTVNKDLTVSGNLVVNGTTTTVNSTTTTLDDPIITLGGDTAPSSDDNKDRGVEFKWHNGSAAKVGFFGYDDSTGKLTFIPDATNSSEVFSGTLGTIDVGAVHINGSQIAATNLSNGTTGSGSIVLATSPTLTTPTIGAATATSVATANTLIGTATTTTATVSQTAVTIAASGTYRSVKLIVSATNTTTTAYGVAEILVVHDGTTVYATEYGSMNNGTSPWTGLDADISGGNIRLLVTSAAASSTVYKVHYVAVAI